MTLHRAGCVWVTYTLVIIFLGGIIIVFIYASSIDSVFKLIIKLQKVVFLTIILVALSTLSWVFLLNTNHYYATPV